MSTRTQDTLHDIHTATNDVLKGYREMLSRAEPEIQPVLQRLTQMHERHAAEQALELARLHESGADDRSMQGTVNQVVVILRDWLSDLDQDVLPAVRKGEEALREEYSKALVDGPTAANARVFALLRAQMDVIDSEIARLPPQ